MKIIDMLPIIAFFVVAKTMDFYAATKVLMVLLVLLAAFYWIKERKMPKGHTAVAVLGCVLGGATLYFHSTTFLQYKLTVVYWVFGAALLFSQFFGDKPLAQRAGETALQLPDHVWRGINLSWALFFLFVGGMNVAAIKFLSEDGWVNFKAATIVMNFIFAFAQIPFLYKYLPKEEEGQK